MSNPYLNWDQERGHAEARISSIEEMISDLTAAGWRKEGSASWRSPWGSLFRGPFQAWKAQLEYWKLFKHVDTETGESWLQCLECGQQAESALEIEHSSTCKLRGVK